MVLGRRPHHLLRVTKIAWRLEQNDAVVGEDSKRVCSRFGTTLGIRNVSGSKHVDVVNVIYQLYATLSVDCVSVRGRMVTGIRITNQDMKTVGKGALQQVVSSDVTRANHPQTLRLMEYSLIFRL